MRTIIKTILRNSETNISTTEVENKNKKGNKVTAKIKKGSSVPQNKKATSQKVWAKSSHTLIYNFLRSELSLFNYISNLWFSFISRTQSLFLLFNSFLISPSLLPILILSHCLDSCLYYVTMVTV